MRIPLSLALLAGLFAASAQAATVTTPRQDQPGETAKVSGMGFGAGEAVDIYLDTADTKLLGADASGAFSGSIVIPISTDPGKHTISAVGRTSGRSAQTPIVVTTAWHEFAFGLGHRGSNPYERTLSKRTVPNLARIWANKTLLANYSQPVVVYPHVYVTTRDGVAALHVATGTTVWTALPGESFQGSPTVYERVYAASTTGVVYALDRATGRTIWSHALGGIFHNAPALADGMLYVGSEWQSETHCACLYALNADTGVIRWIYHAGVHIFTAPVVVGGLVYVRPIGEAVVALKAETGAVIWSNGTLCDYGSCSPIVAKGMVYIGSPDFQTVTAEKASTGEKIWTATLDGPAAQMLAFANDTVYASTDNASVYALDANSGAVRWKASLPTSAPHGAGVTVANGVVYVTFHNSTFPNNIHNLYALDAYSGAILASYPIGLAPEYGPSISDGVLYFSGYADSKGIFAMSPRAAALTPVQPPKPSELHPDLGLAVSK